MEKADHKESITAKERVSTYLYFSSFYFVAVGILYLWGFWSTFNINILEYLSLSDVLKSTAYPVASAFISFAVGAVIGELLTGERLPSGGGRKTRVAHFLAKVMPFLLMAYVIGTIMLGMFGPPEKWLVLPVLFAPPAYFLAKKRGFMTSLIPHDSTRSIIIFLIAALPTYAYGTGRLQAAAILEGKNYTYVVSQIEGFIPGDSILPNQRLRFLGHAGDFIFLLNPDDNILMITKIEATKTLQLKQFKTTSQGRN